MSGSKLAAASWFMKISRSDPLVESVNVGAVCGDESTFAVEELEVVISGYWYVFSDMKGSPDSSSMRRRLESDVADNSSSVLGVRER